MGLVEGGYKPVPRDDFQKTGGGSRGWQGGGGRVARKEHVERK